MQEYSTVQLGFFEGAPEQLAPASITDWQDVVIGLTVVRELLATFNVAVSTPAALSDMFMVFAPAKCGIVARLARLIGRGQ